MDVSKQPDWLTLSKKFDWLSSLVVILYYRVRLSVSSCQIMCTSFRVTLWVYKQCPETFKSLRVTPVAALSRTLGDVAGLTFLATYVCPQAFYYYGVTTWFCYSVHWTPVWAFYYCGVATYVWPQAFYYCGVATKAFYYCGVATYVWLQVLCYTSLYYWGVATYVYPQAFYYCGVATKEV